MNYWDLYYSTETAPQIPSQFAVFALGELDFDSVVDLGCGNGRDAEFFVRMNKKVFAVDKSTAGLEYLRKSKSEVQVFQCDFESVASLDRLADVVSSTDQRLFYARFLLHAIPENARKNLFKWLSCNMRPGDSLALEFRTDRDRNLPKQTKDHFREGLNPGTVAHQVIEAGLAIAYHVEGFGFAKFGVDDAHVARVIATA